jgi:hypothetical protein
MKNAIIASLASIPFAVAGVLSAGAANAAALSGQFSFDGIDDPDTTVVFGADFLDFKPDGNSQVDLKLKTEDFLGINSADIFDLAGIAALDGVDTNLPDVLFMDFGGGKTLSLTSVTDYTFVPKVGTTDINMGFMGFFDNNGEKSEANGSITFQTLGTITQADLDAGNTYEATFSGITVASESVPEPTTILGLGVVAAGSAFGLKKKNS